ncbi:hypothetical protein NN561_006758 [Cricetulus griseus]
MGCWLVPAGILGPAGAGLARWRGRRSRRCSRTCGKGWRKRAVSCKSTNPSARAQLLHDAACTAEPKPRTHEVCLLKRCHKHKKLQWLVSAWSQVCSSDSPQNSVSLFSPSCLLLPPLPSLCLLTLSEFSFRCFESVTSLSHGLRSPASLASMPTSLDIQSLFTMTLCSVTCERGMQQRVLRCAEKYISGKYRELASRKCLHLPKPDLELERTCGPFPCPKHPTYHAAGPPRGSWFASPWSQCTASCGGGVQRRTVQCLLGGQPASDCFLHQKPETSLACNTHFCPISEKRGEYRAPQLDLGVSGGDVKLLE